MCVLYRSGGLTLRSMRSLWATRVAEPYERQRGRAQAPLPLGVPDYTWPRVGAHAGAFASARGSPGKSGAPLALQYIGRRGPGALVPSDPAGSPRDPPA